MHVKDQLLGLLKRARRKSLTPADCYELQRDLVSAIIRVERFIRNCTKNITRLSQKKGNSERLAALKSLRSDLEWHRASLRLVGDTLVYRFAPQHLVRRLYNRSDPGWLLGKKGTKFELKSARQLMRRGEFAFLADATHCIRAGDIFSVSKDGGRLIEIKSGGKIKDAAQIEREGRQLRRLELRDALLAESLPGFTAIEAGTGKEYWKLAEAMLRGARSSPKLKSVEPGLKYAAVHSKAGDKFEKKLGPYFRESKYLIGQVSRRVNEMAIVEPFTLFLAPAIARQLVSGKLELFTIIDFEFVTREFAKIGIQPVLQNNVLTHFRATAGDAVLDTYLLDTVGHACRSLADVMHCYGQLMAAHNDPQTAIVKGAQIDPKLMETLALLDMKVPEEMKRAMAKMKKDGVEVP